MFHFFFLNRILLFNNELFWHKYQIIKVVFLIIFSHLIYNVYQISANDVKIGS